MHQRCHIFNTYFSLSSVASCVSMRILYRGQIKILVTVIGIVEVYQHIVDYPAYMVFGFLLFCCPSNSYESTNTCEYRLLFFDTAQLLDTSLRRCIIHVFEWVQTRITFTVYCLSLTDVYSSFQFDILLHLCKKLFSPGRGLTRDLFKDGLELEWSRTCRVPSISTHTAQDI